MDEFEKFLNKLKRMDDQEKIIAIQKFESFEDAEKALWCFEPDEAYYKRVAELFKIANHLCPPNFPRGLFKYRTIEEANKQKQEWLLANALKKKRFIRSGTGPAQHS